MKYTRLAPAAASDVDLQSRVARYVFSDESVGRDGHIVLADAWRTENFANNPVFCWCHDDSQPPIGRVFDLHTESKRLCGAVKYAETEFADVVYQLVRDGFLNATSTSWLPLDSQPRKSGGLIFTEVDLLEISQVPVPALPTALATARKRGLNLRPLADWAARALERSRQPIPRPELEAIYRSATASRLTLVSGYSSGYAARAARAQAIQDRVERSERALKLLLRGKRELTPANEKVLQKAQAHCERALKHHRTVEKHHDEIGAGVTELNKVHRQLTKTLSSLGERGEKALTALKRCMRSISRAHGDAGDAHGLLGDALGDAQGCVNNVLDGDVDVGDP